MVAALRSTNWKRRLERLLLLAAFLKLVTAEAGGERLATAEANKFTWQVLGALLTRIRPTCSSPCTHKVP